jgi:site-specific recombinase XerD
MTFHSIINEFLSEQDISDISRKAYRNWLKPFQKWATDNAANVHDIKKYQIINYKKHITGTYQDKSVNCYLTAIRMLYNWMESNRMIQGNPTTGVKLIRLNKPYRKKSLTTNQVVALMTSFNDSPTSRRNKAIVTLMLSTGMRAVEVSRVLKSDITPEAIEVQGKGRFTKDTKIKMDANIYNICMAQIINQETNYLFHTIQGQPLTPKYISEIISQQMKAADIKTKDISCHSLRHTYAIRVMSKTNDLMRVMEYMRHSNPKTTMVYMGAIKANNPENDTMIHELHKDLTEAIRANEKGKNYT